MQDIRDSLDRYVKDGIDPGDFLTAVLENKLKETFERADHVNIHRLFAIVDYCYHSIPAHCWGSKEIVKAWMVYKKQYKNNKSEGGD